MTTAVQVQYRRGTSSQVAAFTGAQGEMVVDTTNNRVVVQDGSTEGGWPAAKLSEVITNMRTAVSDANYTAQTTDRLIAYTAITAARTVTLPAAASFPTGTRLLVVDESGSCSATDTITISRAGSDTISGATSAVLNMAYGYVAMESNGSNAWTIVDSSSEALASVAITGGTINGTTVGATTAAAGAFTTLSASSTVSGSGFSTYLASPPAIGGTAAAAVTATSLTATGAVSLSPENNNVTLSPTGSGEVIINPAIAGTINNMAIGGTTRASAVVTALGVGESAPGAGIVNVSGSYQVAGSQISAANLSDGTTGTGAIVKANAPAFTGNPTGITALGINESTPGTGIVNISGTYQVGGSQISTANLSDGTTGTGAIVKANAPSFTGNPTGITALGVNESTPGTGIVNVSGSYQVGGSQIAVGNLASINNNTIVGNNSGGSAAPSALTAANVQAMVSQGLIAISVGSVNLNSTGDTAITINLPTGITNYKVLEMLVWNASTSLTTAKMGLYTAASQGGTNVIAQTALSAVTNTSANSTSSSTSIAGSGVATIWLTATTLYLNVGTAQGATATANFTLLILPLM
ncbi:MAG: hypothetical protein ABSD08_08700 [Xanthobacteraceae bacterium]|jgi:hypothetical protein